MVALTIDGPGLVGPDCRLTAHFCDAAGELLGSEELALRKRQPEGWLAMITGRPLDEAYRELVLINREPSPAGPQLGAEADRDFTRKRRLIARELRNAGLF